MRRKLSNKLRRGMDPALLGSIREGKGTPAERQESCMPYLEGVPWIEIITGFVKSEESSATQRLRKSGDIEIGADLVAKPVEEISPSDADAIIARRTISEIGQVKNLCRFAHGHGRHEECSKHLKVLMILMPYLETEKEVAEYCGFTL